MPDIAKLCDARDIICEECRRQYASAYGYCTQCKINKVVNDAINETVDENEEEAQ